MKRVLLVLLATTTASAAPRPGANHRLGDDSFVAAYGRLPDGRDAEQLRMRVHLRHVRAQLANQPATRPELAARRTELLGYLDDYIAKGITPLNTNVPLRSPVFIDDFGNVCAVGYLIERSVGRGVAEAIAKAHRFDYLEDIAAAMPEVRAWIAASGFTLDELASIQPGYVEPAVDSWHPFDVAAWKVPDGAHTRGGALGTLKRGRMEGEWKVVAGERVVGKGTLRRGAGTWTSFYDTGEVMARGAIVANVAAGEWTLFHRSGNVAARGSFKRGVRDGAWQFFYDTPRPTPIARGSFGRGSVIGTWRHYDLDGKLLATSAPTRPPNQYEDATLMTFEPMRGIQHEVHRVGGVDGHKLHGFYKGGERIYMLFDQVWDARGKLLSLVDGKWMAVDCKWSAKRKAIARGTDITSLHYLLSRDDSKSCTGTPEAIGARRAARIAELVAASKAIRVPAPEFVKQLATDQFASADDPESSDVAQLIVAGMGWYVEWPHIDGRFMQLHKTMAGYRYYANGDVPQTFPDDEPAEAE